MAGSMHPTDEASVRAFVATQVEPRSRQDWLAWIDATLAPRADRAWRRVIAAAPSAFDVCERAVVRSFPGCGVLSARPALSSVAELLSRAPEPVAPDENVTCVELDGPSRGLRSTTIAEAVGTWIAGPPFDIVLVLRRGEAALVLDHHGGITWCRAPRST